MDRETILAVAETQFFHKEFQSVKLESVAAELWIKKPSLYYYFDSKRSLFEESVKYSLKKYLVKMREVLATQDLFDIIHWYLAFPSGSHNLYAITAQHGRDVSNETAHVMSSWRQVIETELTRYLKEYGLDEVQVFCIINLLDKLAMDNCTEGYCLEYSVTDLTEAIEELIEKK